MHTKSLSPSLSPSPSRGSSYKWPSQWSHDHATRCIIYTVSISISIFISVSMHNFLYIIYVYIYIYTYIHMLWWMTVDHTFVIHNRAAPFACSSLAKAFRSSKSCRRGWTVGCYNVRPRIPLILGLKPMCTNHYTSILAQNICAFWEASYKQKTCCLCMDLSLS